MQVCKQNHTVLLKWSCRNSKNVHLYYTSWNIHICNSFKWLTVSCCLFYEIKSKLKKIFVTLQQNRTFDFPSGFIVVHSGWYSVSGQGDNTRNKLDWVITFFPTNRCYVEIVYATYQWLTNLCVCFKRKLHFNELLFCVDPFSFTVLVKLLRDAATMAAVSWITVPGPSSVEVWLSAHDAA